MCAITFISSPESKDQVSYIDHRPSVCPLNFPFKDFFSTRTTINMCVDQSMMIILSSNNTECAPGTDDTYAMVQRLSVVNFFL